MRHLYSLILLLLITSPVSANVLDMRLLNINGNEEPMSDYIGNGQWVLVNVWSPDCSACRTELPQIKKFIQRNPEIAVIGITLDFPSFAYGKIDTVRNFVKRQPLNYPLFLADINQASELIGLRLVGIPLIAIYHPDGRALARWPGVVEIDEIEKFIANYKDDKDPLSIDFN